MTKNKEDYEKKDLTSYRNVHRFEALDAWRGICACFIVFSHFNYDMYSHFREMSLSRSAYLFVDFFFVLSGFVITASYEDKIFRGMPFRDYIILRFGRIYPLHITVLALFVAFEFSKFFLPMNSRPFSEEFTSVSSLIGNIFLVHSMGFFRHTSWNAPSWSISVEFYTYILFFMAAFLLRQSIRIPAIVIMIVMPFVFMALGKPDMDILTDYGFLRCIYGFSAGILCFKTYERIKDLNTISVVVSTALEAAVVASIIAFITFFADDQRSFWSPYLFFVSILVFSFQRGWISGILLTRPCLFVGKLSYSIYMTHVFTQLIVVNIVKVIEKKLPFFMTQTYIIDGEQRSMLGHNIWQGDLWQIGGLVMVFCVSTMTYRLIEAPCNRWAREYVRNTSVTRSWIKKGGQ